jgi:DNA-binding MarR family transcriptional regulator
MRGVGADDGSQLAVNLGRLAVRLRRSTAARMADETWASEAGFRPGCVGVMLTIERHQPVSQQRISAETGLDPSDVVGMVDILEAASLVERHRDARDRRRYSLELTAVGRARAERLHEILDAVIDEVISPLSPADRDQFAALVNVVMASHSVGETGGQADDAAMLTPSARRPSPEKERARPSPQR